MTVGTVALGEGSWTMAGAASAGVSAGSAPGDGISQAGGTGLAEQALEILMVGEAEFVEAGLRTSATAVRHAAERRIEQRAKIRELQQRIAEAQANRSWWQKFCDALGWVGKVLGAVGGALAVVATAGAALPAALTIGVAVGAGAAGLTSAIGRLGLGAAEREIGQRNADQLAAEGEQAEWTRLGRDGQALAEALVGLESAMREQALRWIGNEDASRRLAAGRVLER